MAKTRRRGVPGGSGSGSGTNLEAPTTDAKDHDSDTSDSDSDCSSPGRHRHRRRRRGSLDSSSGTFSSSPTDDDNYYYEEDEDADYAPLFNRYKFHAQIPLLRRPWKYRLYRVAELEGLDAAGLEEYGWDYPLNRLRRRAVWPVRTALRRVPGLRWLGRAYFEHEREYRLESEPDELVRRLVKERMELKELRELRELREMREAAAGGFAVAEVEGAWEREREREVYGRRARGLFRRRRRLGDEEGMY